MKCFYLLLITEHVSACVKGSKVGLDTVGLEESSCQGWGPREQGPRSVKEQMISSVPGGGHEPKRLSGSLFLCSMTVCFYCRLCV